MLKPSGSNGSPAKLAIAVTFHFVEERLQYLDLISDQFASLADEVLVFIVTNEGSSSRLEQIRQVVKGKGFEVKFLVPTGLGHPYLLTWSHFFIFRKLIKEQSVTHFMYVEDDILVTQENVQYWLEGRERLRKSGFIPSFLRVEKKKNDPDWYSTDCVAEHVLTSLSMVRVAKDYSFVSLRTPYQGMYFLDRELMLEHLNGRSSVPEYHRWGIREMAAQGLTFSQVPKGFHSRNLLPVRLSDGCEVDPRCLIHHTPNNYAEMDPPLNNLGTIKVKNLVRRSDG